MKNKADIAFIFIALIAATPVYAEEGLTLQNSINQNYFVSINNVNSQTALELPNDSIVPIGNSQVPDYSYFYNGQYSIMDLQCSLQGQTSASGDIYIQYSNTAGIQSVKGQCQVQFDGQPMYIVPMWDGSPHGTVLFNMNLKGLSK